MNLSRKVRSGVFSVINNGNEKIDFQVSAKEWKQDEKGKDIYEDTEDIIFFPKVMSVEPNSQRAIRVGLKTPPSAREKTYRLFVQEIPTPKKKVDLEVGEKKNIQAGLTIAFRFAMPIFLEPLKPQESYAFDGIEMSKRMLKVSIKNTGNVHIKTRDVQFSGKDADGKEIFSKEVAGWYILSGVTSSYETEVPKEVCGKLVRIEISAQTENSSINGNLNVQKNMCAE